jgi:biopolymer transport protein ExbD
MAKKKREQEPVELNMIPIMNLFLAMIPFLLSCAAFFQAAQINASVPALSEGSDASSDEPAKELKKITLNLQIKKEGFFLSASGDQPPAEIKGIARTIAKKGDEYDFEELAKVCKSLKAKYDKSDTVILLPIKEISYETLIHAMDAARDYVIDKKLDHRSPLFNNAVVSSLL